MAEVGAAFLSADLGIASGPRADRAKYLTNWLQVVKNDKGAVFTSASPASKAVTFLRGSYAALARLARPAHGVVDAPVSVPP